MEKVINLESLASGAVTEKFNQELEKVLRNLMDLNTDYKKPRKLQLEYVFSTTKNRYETNVDFTIKTILVPDKPVSSRIIMGMDAAGKVLAQEYEKGIIPGQCAVDEETGEVVYGVVDFREAVK